MKRLFKISLVGWSSMLICLYFPFTAMSQEIPSRGPIPFAVFDSDGNGFISEEEFNSVRAKRMETRAAEGRPMRGAAGAPAFSVLDTNSDERLTQEELAEGQKASMMKRGGVGGGPGRGMGQGSGMRRNMPAFGDFDLNQDGKIVEKEFNEAKARRITERAKQGYQMKNLANSATFSDIDINDDGEVSEEEFERHQLQRRQ